MHPAIQTYLDELKQQFYTGHAREHSYRPALKSLMMTFERMNAINEPKQSEHGAPDFIFLSSDNNDLILGYAEAKDIDTNLDRVEKSEQLTRYGGYENLFLTNYLEFRFYTNGEKYETISLGEVKNGVLHLDSSQGERLIHELQAFLELPPETIKNGKRLATIMGGKARRIRDNVAYYLEHDEQNAGELNKIYEMMKKLLVHDLDHAKFADMYAQTLVYGLFVARYGDSTDHDFSRSEARDLVPASNPFLRHFFDHIAGTGFDRRLAKIVDELCEIFSVSNVQEIVHKHLKVTDTSTDAKDPIIHFYEDFLQAYDPAERKRMGAYYTPTPVVQFIVRHIDRILKEDFGIAKGLASTETITRRVEVGQDMRVDRRHKAQTKQTLVEPRVQILDPAVGTATFLNETIKYIYQQNFQGKQEGMWPSYANDNLVPRLFGFELMMAPYTIAHLKLGMTLRETGVDKLTSRLNVFLTNTLEEGVPQQRDLFSFGLAEAVSEESRLASEVKSERPVMVVMGNPPYSVSSNNKSKYIQNLIADYKKDLGERKINLDDDYIKFIRFAEEMIAKNGSGIVAMITNNSYIDGITHRQMRKHLLQTFDKIYVLDLHGNAKKKEVAPDGGKDENVFDIMQGVSIVLMVKTGEDTTKLGEVYHAELWGKRQSKFDDLNDNAAEYSKIEIREPNYFYVHKDYRTKEDYDTGIQLNSLFTVSSSGVKTERDRVTIKTSSDELLSIVNDFRMLPVDDIRKKYDLHKESRDWGVERAKQDVMNHGEYSKYVKKIMYRPFDIQYIYYTGTSKGFIGTPGYKINKQMLDDNLGIVVSRQQKASGFQHVLAADMLVESSFVSNKTSEFGYIFPLYLYHPDGTRTPNFAPAELSALTRQLSGEPSPEDILDYIYAVLHSPSYREKYKEFLKIDFPRVPVPTQADFDRLVPLGRELRQLHLMKSPIIDDYATTYPEAGDNVVEKLRYEDEKVWINTTQYFGNVPELAWNFYIGGYQPAQKWLKDRAFSKTNRPLSNKDLDHYQRIIKILLETDRIMKEIG